MNFRVTLISVVALAACGPQTPATTSPQTPQEVAQAMPQSADEATAQDTCGAAAYQHLIGTPASAIDQAALPANTRIVTPDSIVTQDFRPERLNIMTGTDGLVSSMRCY